MSLRVRYVAGIVLLVVLLLTILNRFWGLLVIADKVVLHGVLFASMWALVVVMRGFARGAERGLFLLWPERKQGWRFHALSFIGLFAATMLLGIVNRLIGGAPDAAQAAKDMAYWDAHPLLFVFMGLTAGCTEELLMRGYVQPRLLELTRSTWAAILGSAALFALAHYTNSPPPKLILLFLQGIIWAWHYHRYRSLVALMLTHVLIDVARF